MSDHFNRLTEAEAERLALLIEECGEVIQAGCKILRHGYENRNPDLPMSPTNRGFLAKEIGHVLHAVNRMTEAHDFGPEAVELSQMEKADKSARFLHHQTETVRQSRTGGQS